MFQLLRQTLSEELQEELFVIDKSITSFCKISNKFPQFSYYRLKLKMKTEKLKLKMKMKARWAIELLSMADTNLPTYRAFP